MRADDRSEGVLVRVVNHCPTLWNTYSRSAASPGGEGARWAGFDDTAAIQQLPI